MGEGDDWDGGRCEEGRWFGSGRLGEKGCCGIGMGEGGMGGWEVVGVVLSSAPEMLVWGVQ